MSKSNIITCFEHLDYAALRQRISSRKVFLWGAFKEGHSIRKLLEEKGISVSAYIDTYYPSESYDGLPLCRPQNIPNSRDVFVVVALRKKQEVKKLLEAWSGENDGFSFPMCELPEIFISHINCNYSDNYGISVKIRGVGVDFSIKFVGYNNKLQIGTEVYASRRFSICAEDASTIIIGNDSQFGEGCSIHAYEGGDISLGDGIRIQKGTKFTSRESIITVGARMSTGEHCVISSSYKPITIGEDAMLSDSVRILGSSGHSLINLMNKSEELHGKETGVRIGRHVWIGINSTILPTTEIGNGSVIGAASVVKLKCGDYSVLVGNPARVIKTGFTWERWWNSESTEAQY